MEAGNRSRQSGEDKIEDEKNKIKVESRKIKDRRAGDWKPESGDRKRQESAEKGNGGLQSAIWRPEERRAARMLRKKACI